MGNKSNSIFEEAVNIYRTTPSINKVARIMGICEVKAKRILATAGVLETQRALEITELLEDMTETEIAKKLKVAKKTVSNYTSYKKGMYKLPDESCTLNALRIRQHRKKKKSTPPLDKL